MTCGIYMIQNTINGKIYIGQSIDIELRFKSHKNKLERGNHDNIHLQKSWRKYGKEKFEFDILCECEEEKLNETEEYYIFELMTYNSRIGYNKNYGGSSGRPTEETKKKLSEAGKGRQHTEETKKKMSEAKKGKSFSEEHRKKLSENNIWNNKKRCEEARKKISEAFKGENNPNSKTIVQIDQNTNKIVNTYSGTHEAARQTGFSQGNINACCNNKYCRPGNNIYKGYKWMFLEVYNKLNN